MNRDWPLRDVPSSLREHYLQQGWWTDDTVGDLVDRGLSGKKHLAFAVHSRTRPWVGTMGDVRAAARTFAASLHARGVGPGDVVVFQLPNCREAAIAFWGAAYLGAIVVPVVHFYGAKELRYVLEVTRPKALVTMHRFGSRDYTSEYASVVAPLLDPDGGWYVVDGDVEQLPANAHPFAPLLEGRQLETPLPADPDAPALIAFTSGTTRDPKGVMHTHRTIGFEARQIRQLGSPDEPRPFLTGAPVGHFMGMLGSLLAPLLSAGLPVHLIDVWDPAEVLRLLVSQDLLMSGGSSYFVTSLLDHPSFSDEHLAHLPHTGLGGSTVPAALIARLAGLGIDVYRSYGSTEHPSATGCNLADPRDKRHDTDGKALEGTEVQLDADGQILLRGAELFLGYTDPALTKQAFDSDGWYRTGDVGVFDEDGYLTITDRLADFIIRGGENISAVEVEDLLTSLPDVLEVCVVAVPDARLGERAAAVLRLHPHAPTPSVAAIGRHLQALGLAKQKWPEAVCAVQELPRTPSGKVQKAVLRQWLRDGTVALER